MSDLCTDCGRVFALGDLFRGGRRVDGDWLVVRLCLDCLYAVNPYLQRNLIDAAIGNISEAERKREVS